MLSISAKYGKRRRTWGPFSQTFEQGRNDAEHLIVNWLRLKPGFTGECWQFGVCTLTSRTTGRREVLELPPYLQQVEAPTGEETATS
jgi:hypothetical protein